MNIGQATLTWYEAEAPQHPGDFPWFVTCTNGYADVVWLLTTTSSSDVTVVVDTSGGTVDPGALAAELLDQIPVPAIEVGMNPTPGLVAVPSWYWIEGYDGAPISESESLAGTTVEVQITPTAYDWNFGDGQELSTSSVGKAYPAISDIKHTYEQSSFGAGGSYIVTVKLTFSVRYRVSGGAWQGLDPITRTFTASYAVQQLQSVLTAQ